MKKITFLSFFIALFVFTFSNAQSLSKSIASGNISYNGPAGSVSLSFGDVNQNRAPVVITHSLSQTVTPLNSVTCNAGGLPAENSFYRVFDLANDFGISGNFDVTNAEFAIETVSANTNLTVNIYSTNSVFPAGYPGSLTLQGTASVLVTPADIGNVVSGVVSATIPAGEIMVYELLIPDLQGVGISFFPGSNALGETDPSYIRAPSCGLVSPSTLAAIGFPNQHMIMNIVGEENFAISTCATDTPLPLGPGSGVTTLSTVNISQVGNIGISVGDYILDEVSMNLIHTWADDLEIVLISPSGTQVALSTDNGGSTGLDIQASLVFRDDSPNNVTAWTGGLPLANYRAEGGAFTHPVAAGAGPGVDLNTVLAGEAINGNWTLRLYDDTGGDGGTIFDYCIDFIEVTPIGDPPAIVCPLDITINNTTGTCGAQVFFANAVAIDPEDGLIAVSQTMGPGTGSIFPIGDTIIEFSATDSDGNTSTCQFTITVLDVDDPIAVCQNITVELDAAGSVMINAADLDGGSSDACGAVTFSFDMAGAVTTMMFDCADLGDNTITLYVTDEGGNVVSCETIVTVEDNIAPEIVCASNLSTVTDSVSSSPGVAIPDNSPTGVSSTLTITDDEIITDIDIDVNISHTWVGDVSVTITSPAGTSVTIIDRPGVPATTFGCSGDNIVATLDDDAATPVENECVAAVPTINGTFSPNNPLTAFNGESTLGTWTITATDAAAGDIGTLNSWGVVYSYEEAGGPIPQYFLDANGEVTVPITDLYTSVSDNADSCGITVTVGGSGTSSCEQSNPSNNFEEALGFFAAPNPAIQILSVDLIVEEGQNFILDNVTPNLFVQSGSPNEIESVSVFIYESNGNVPGALITSQANIVPTSQNQVGTLGGGYISEVVLDIDPVLLAGDVSNATTYWVGISMFGTINNALGWEISTNNVPNNFMAFSGDSGATFTSTADIGFLADGVYTFGGTCEPLGGGSNAIFTCADLGVINVTVTATDAAGNSTSCVTQIEIIDNIAPVLVTQDITVELDENGEASIVYQDLYASSPDDFEVITIGGDNGSFAAGTTDLTVPVTEAASITFDWDYSTGDIPGFDSFGYLLNGVYTPLTNPAIGNQSGTGAVAVNPGDVFGFRSQTVDNFGGAGTTLISNFMPGFQGQFAPANWTETLTNSDGSATFITIPGGVLAFDNCGITTGAVDISNFTCADIGTPVTVTVFVSDASGNIASSTAVVTVVDLLGPVFDCPDDMTVDTDPGSITYTLPDYIGDGLASVTDNCTDPVTVFSQSPAPGSLLLDGTYTITLTAEDEYGNESTCSFELTVETILGTDENELGNAITMYPNPANSYVDLRNSSNIALTEATIYDITGKLVSSFDLTQMVGEQRLDVSNLASGVYLVYINSETASVVKRLIKK